MKHKSTLKGKEKIKAYLALSDFLLDLMRSNLSKKEYELRLKKMREEHLKRDYLLLSRLGRLK